MGRWASGAGAAAAPADALPRSALQGRCTAACRRRRRGSCASRYRRPPEGPRRGRTAGGGGRRGGVGRPAGGAGPAAPAVSPLSPQRLRWLWPFRTKREKGPFLARGEKSPGRCTPGASACERLPGVDRPSRGWFCRLDRTASQQ